LNCVSLVWRGKFKDIFGGKDRGFICLECKGLNTKCRQQWLAIGLRSGGRNNLGRRGLSQLVPSIEDIFGGKDRRFICWKCKGLNAKCRQQRLAIGLPSGGRNNFGRRGLCQLAHCAALPHRNMPSFYLLLYCDLVKKLNCKKYGGFS